MEVADGGGDDASIILIRSEGEVGEVAIISSGDEEEDVLEADTGADEWQVSGVPARLRDPG